jgi:hypothetical protein
MFALNSNNEAKQYQRFMDINEPLTMMTPIKGYDQMPLVPLEQAVQSLVPFIAEVQQSYRRSISCYYALYTGMGTKRK